MRIKNMNAQKSFILPSKNVLSGGLLSKEKKTVTFRPNDVIDMPEDKALALANSYPKIMVMDEVHASKLKQGVKTSKKGK